VSKDDLPRGQVQEHDQDPRQRGIHGFVVATSATVTRMSMMPRIVENSGMTLAGLSARFISILSPDRNNHVVIPALWARYGKRAGELTTRRAGVDWGLFESLQANDRSHPDELSYTAAAELLSPVETLPEGFSLKRIPPGRYAVFTHKGKLDGLAKTMTAIHEKWLPKSGRMQRDGPHLERYDHQRFRADSADSELELWVPVR
jgi:AraC family transcriptional regulator